MQSPPPYEEIAKELPGNAPAGAVRASGESSPPPKYRSHKRTPFRHTSSNEPAPPTHQREPQKSFSLHKSPKANVGLPRESSESSNSSEGYATSSESSRCSSTASYSKSHDGQDLACRTTRLPTVKQKKGAFIWPRGGRRSGTLARFKDILTGRGPDIYVAVNHFGRAAGARDGPSFGRWSGWGDSVDDPKTSRMDGRSHFGDLPFSGRRDPKKRYDYGTRKYKYAQPGDIMQASFYKAPDGKKRVPSTAKHYTDQGCQSVVVKYHLPGA